MRARRVHAKPRENGNRAVGGRSGTKRRFVEEASDSSDEDFVVGEEEEEEEEDDNDDIMSTEEEEEEEEEEEQSTFDEYSEELSDSPKSRKTGARTRTRAEALRKKPRNRATKRVKILSSDDEDFQPDFASSPDYSDDEEEEEVVVIKRPRPRRKRGRKSKNVSTRKSKTGGRKRRRTPASGKVAKKQMNVTLALRKSDTKRRKTMPLSRNLVRNTTGSNSNSDEDFLIPPNERARHRRNCSSNPKKRSNSQCRRKLTSSSASDFSDLDSDYTIWEEGNEPLYKPAHRRKPTSRLTRSSFIQKQETVSSTKGCQNKKHTSLLNCNFNKAEEGLMKKGKEKIEGTQVNETSELGKPVCGVCLSDDGKANRGKLDCCDHYFCFACIMEWAKVESRCPMCKQRFVSISKSGKGLHGRKISVPLRDQVYQPSEEEIMGFLDPYANIVCSECHQAGDDDLLLLCDFCDSAYHTYCVGLGRAVPEGDWYCGGCQTCMPGHSSTQEEEGDDFVLDFDNEDCGSSNRAMVEERAVAGLAEERVNSHRILSSLSSTTFTERRPRQARTIRRRVARRSTPNIFLSPPRLPDLARASLRRTQVSGSQSQVSSAGARTLSGQRRLQEHIQVLRDNLSLPERSCLHFSPDSSPIGFNSNMSDGDHLVVQPAPLNRSCFSSEVAQRNNWDTTASPENAAFKSDVDQAWALMEHARMLGGRDVDLADNQRVGRYCQGPPIACMKENSSELMCNARPRVISGSNSSADARSRTSSIQNRQGSVMISTREENLARTRQEVRCIESGNNMLPGNNSPSRPFVPQLSQRNNSPGHQLNGPISFGLHPNSSSRVLLPQSSQRFGGPSLWLNDPIAFGSHPNEAEVWKVDGAKQQIQAMVKAHMKPMHRKKQIGNEQFKEIARCCTHTILAACGLEHSKSRVQPIELVTCCHPALHCEPSDLMPGCCSECFKSFVKDVVVKITGQKVSKEI